MSVFSESVKSAIHLLSSALEIPAILILLLFVGFVLFEAGRLTVEGLGERLRRPVGAEGLLEAMQGKNPEEIENLLNQSGITEKLRRPLTELLRHAGLREPAREALARKLLADEEQKRHRKIAATDVMVRLGPMFGLMATLIPLGPGLIALGQGDTRTLASSLLTAFDATVAGLLVGGTAFILSRIRKHWYEGDLLYLETLMEGVMEELNCDETGA